MVLFKKKWREKNKWHYSCYIVTLIVSTRYFLAFWHSMKPAAALLMIARHSNNQKQQPSKPKGVWLYRRKATPKAKEAF